MDVCMVKYPLRYNGASDMKWRKTECYKNHSHNEAKVHFLSFFMDLLNNLFAWILRFVISC